MLTLLVPPVCLQASEGKQSLAGIKEVQVLVEGLPSQMNSYLTVDQLRVDVELRLRKAGITVVSHTDATLYINVNITCLDSGACAFNLNLEMWQDVMLMRNKQYARAMTWFTGGIGGDPSKVASAQHVRSRLADYVDEFLNDYLSVNPVTRNQ